MDMPVRAVNVPVIPMPTLGFLKKLFQNIASVHDGIIYGKTNTKEINFLYFKLDLVISHATMPPKTMAINDALIAIKNVLYSGL